MKNTIHKGNTKIVATLGPASSTYETIYQLVQAGASMFRLNTSHGTPETHMENIKNIRKVSKDLETNIPILVDLQGPKIRVGNLPEAVEIKKGDKIKLKAGAFTCGIIPVDYDGIADDVKTGDKILLDDGKVGLKVLDIDNKIVFAEVLHGTCIKPRKGINLPGSTASLDAVTERDIEFIKFAINNDADYIAQSFVREACDVEKAKTSAGKFR